MRVIKPKGNAPPKHLSKRAAAFWCAITDKYEFEVHELERLLCACEQIDIIDASEAAIRRDGPFVQDRYGQQKAHPAIRTAQDARVIQLRALREMGIDIKVPEERRIPRQQRRYQ